MVNQVEVRSIGSAICEALALDASRIDMLTITVTPDGATIEYVEHLRKETAPAGKLEAVLKQYKLVPIEDESEE